MKVVMRYTRCVVPFSLLAPANWAQDHVPPGRGPGAGNFATLSRVDATWTRYVLRRSVRPGWSDATGDLPDDDGQCATCGRQIHSVGGLTITLPVAVSVRDRPSVGVFPYCHSIGS